VKVLTFPNINQYSKTESDVRAAPSCTSPLLSCRQRAATGLGRLASSCPIFRRTSYVLSAEFEFECKSNRIHHHDLTTTTTTMNALLQPSRLLLLCLLGMGGGSSSSFGTTTADAANAGKIKGISKGARLGSNNANYYVRSTTSAANDDNGDNKERRRRRKLGVAGILSEVWSEATGASPLETGCVKTLKASTSDSDSSSSKSSKSSKSGSSSSTDESDDSSSSTDESDDSSSTDESDESSSTDR